MSDGIRWIGEHSYPKPNYSSPGMLGGISLTAARGIDAEDFLSHLEAEPLQLDEGHLYKDWKSVTLPDGVDSRSVKYAMYGISGDWVYVLEDWEMATWHLHRYGGPQTAELAGVETVCLSLNRHDPPSRIVHTTSEGRIAGGEFGEDTGRGSELDSALHAAGAVFPSVLDTPEVEVELYWEQNFKELPAAVFSAVEAYSGISISRSEVEYGNLPVVVLFPFS